MINLPPVPHICAIVLVRGYGSALVQVTVGHPFGAKQLPKVNLTYCQLRPWAGPVVSDKGRFSSVYSTAEIQSRVTGYHKTLLCVARGRPWNSLDTTEQTPLWFVTTFDTPDTNRPGYAIETVADALVSKRHHMKSCLQPIINSLKSPFNFRLWR